MNHSIQEALKQAFEKKGWTYQQLGNYLGISDASAHRKLTGKQPIDIGDELANFARILGVTIDVKGGS